MLALFVVRGDSAEFYGEFFPHECFVQADLITGDSPFDVDRVADMVILTIL